MKIICRYSDKNNLSKGEFYTITKKDYYYEYEGIYIENFNNYCTKTNTK